MPEKLVPLLKDGQRVEIAVTPRDFHTAKVVRKGEHEWQTYAEAGYTLWDYYESMEPYNGPKTAREFETAAEERRAARAESAPKAEAKKG